MTNRTRRSFIAGAIAAALPLPALAQLAGQAFSGVDVDVRPLLARGLGPFAEMMRRAALDQARLALSGRFTPGAPVLVIRFDALSLSGSGSAPGGGGGPRGFSGGYDSDYLEGEILLVGRRGEILARRPQLVSHPSQYVGPWYDPAFNQKRAVAISQAYVEWVKRMV